MESINWRDKNIHVFYYQDKCFCMQAHRSKNKNLVSDAAIETL